MPKNNQQILDDRKILPTRNVLVKINERVISMAELIALQNYSDRQLFCEDKKGITTSK